MERSLLIIIGAAGAILAVIAARLLFRREPDVQERERRRIAILESAGRIAEGEVVDVSSAVVTYGYEVGGVSYVVSQDLSVYLAGDSTLLERLSGHVNVRYDRANPANSMVHAGQWSGLGSRGQTLDQTKITTGD